VTVRLTAKLEGAKEMIAALDAIDPKRSKKFLRTVQARSGRIVRDRIRAYMSGPRPQRLDVVSGGLRKSVKFTSSVARGVVEIGVPFDHFWWFRLHEDGSAGGRAQKRGRDTARRGRTRGYPARPAVGPAFASSLPELEQVWVKTWEGQLP